MRRSMYGQTITATEPFVLSKEPRAVDKFLKFKESSVIASACGAVETLVDPYLRGAAETHLYIDSEWVTADLIREPDS